MSIIDARGLAAGTELDCDVCVVGAGAAGLTVAAELLTAGREVCVIESGGFEPEAAIQALYDLHSTGYAPRANFMSRARQFGGSCNLWAGRSMLLQPADLEPRDWVPHSGWPIAHAELAADYARATRILELPGMGGDDLARYLQRLSPGERDIFDGGDFVPTFSLWARSPQRFGADWRSLLRRAAKGRLVHHASVTEICLNEAGSAVEILRVATLEGGAFRIRARRFVLACGGIENARLLLASRSRQPNGVGNDHDVVGRYFMDHPRAVFGRVHVPAGYRLRALRGRPLADGKLQIGIGLSAATQRRERLLNHYVTLEAQSSGYAEARYQALVQTAKVLMKRGHAGSRWDLRSMRIRDLQDMVYLLSPKELMPHPLYRLYVAARDLVPRRARPQTYMAVYFCEQPPDPDSRVALSAEPDALGVPRLRLHWRIDDSVVDSIRRMHDLLGRHLQAGGAGRVEAPASEPSFTDASHHMGTTRMGSDPVSSVVDADCRVHGIANLYVGGSSVFPTAGYANPTLSIVALAIRLARHLARHPAGGRNG